MPPKNLRGGRGPQEGPPTQLHNFHHQQQQPQQQPQPMPQGQYPMNTNNAANNNNNNNSNTSIQNNMNSNSNSNNNNNGNNNNNYYAGNSMANANPPNMNKNNNNNNNSNNNNRNLGNNNNNNSNMYADPSGNNGMANSNMQGRYSQNMNNNNNNNNWGPNQVMNNSAGGQGYNNDYNNNNNMGNNNNNGGNMGGGGGGYGNMMNNNNSNMGGPPQGGGGGGYDMGYNEGGGYVPHQHQQQPMAPRMQPHKSPYPQPPPPQQQQQQQQPPMQGGGGMIGQPPPHGGNPNRMRPQQQQQQPPAMPPQQQQQQQQQQSPHQQRGMNAGVMPPMHQHQHQQPPSQPPPPPPQQPPYGGGGQMMPQPPMGQGNMGGYPMDPYGMDPMQQQPQQQPPPMRDGSYGNGQMDMSHSPPPQQGGGNMHGYGPGGGYNNIAPPPGAQPHQQMNAPMQPPPQMPMQPQHGGANNNRRGGGGNLHMGGGGGYNNNSAPNSNNNSIGGGRVVGGGAPHNMPSPGPGMGPGTNSNLSARPEPWQTPNPNLPPPMQAMGPGGYVSVPPQSMMPPPHGAQTHSPLPQSAGYMSGPSSSMPPPMAPPQLQHQHHHQQMQQMQQPQYYPPPPDQMAMMPPEDMLAADNEQGYGLQNFLEDFELIETCKLQDLFPPTFNAKRDVRCVMAIDGDHMLNKLKDDLRAIEPLSLLHSALPDHLLELVTEHVKGLRAHNVEPAWVFNGVGIVGDVEAFLPSEEELLARDTVWEQLNEGRLPQEDAITEAFQTCSSIGPDVAMAVQRFLRSELGVFCVTAPALNWCQMASFHKEEVVHLLMAHPEMLIVPYDNMKLILDIDLPSGKVTFANRDRVLRTMFPSYCTPTSTAAAGERLLDLGLMTSSCTVIHTARAGLRVSAQAIYQELASPTPVFSRVIDFITHNVRTDNREEAEVLKHPKGRSYVRYSPVFTYNASFESPMVYFQRVLNPKLTNQNMPNNLSKIFGHLVPLSLFYFQFVGLLSVSFMTVVTQAYFYDGCPVSDTTNYHEYMPTLVALRSQIAYQLFAKMSKEVNRLLTRLSWVRWYRDILMPLQRQNDVITLDEWQLEGVEDIAKVDENNLEDVTIATVLSINSTSNCFAPEDTPEWNERKIYHGRKQTFFAVLLKFFDFLGYFSHNPPHDPNAVEDGESAAAESAAPLATEPSIDQTVSGEHEVYNFTSCLSTSLKSCPHDFQDALIRLMELSRIGIMNCEPWECITAKHTPEPECADSPELLLASRIACLISIPYSLPAADREHFTWAPVYSRHLCAFSVAVRAMNSALRGLAEVLTTTVYLSNHSDCHISEFAALTPLLPFGDIPSTIGGLLLHYVLVFPRDYESNCSTRWERCNFLQDKFRAIPDLPVQLQRVMEFTFQALFLLNSLRVLNGRLEEMGEQDRTAGMKSMALSEEVLLKTLDIMREKWQDHLEAPLPVDEHKLWPPPVVVPLQHSRTR